MFESLSDRLSGIFDKLTRRGALSEADVAEAMREVRRALIEADVALDVVKSFTDKVRNRAVGVEVVKSVTPGQMVVKIVHDQLVEMLGADAQPIDLEAPAPVPILMVGLQGSGKTTTTAKIARRLSERQRKKVLMASLDTRRPAAMEQLKVLGQQNGIDTLPIVAGQSATEIASRAITAAKLGGYDVVILDTAGRVTVDDALMGEAAEVKRLTNPHEVLLVADALTGQDAVNTARAFDGQIGITGIVLTRVDGDGRGGAALSMRAVTGKPIKLMGVGEKADALEDFHPQRVADRILGMGDIVALVEKAAANIDAEKAARMAAKMSKGEFDMNDLAEQLKQMQKLGGMSGVLGLMPGMGKMKNQMAAAGIDDRFLGRQIAVIQSMNKKERAKPALIDAKRRKRIAAGSGTDVADVNKVLKMHRQMADVMKAMGKQKGGLFGKIGSMLGGGGMPDLGKMDPAQIEKMAKDMGAGGGLPPGMPSLPPGLGNMPGLPGGFPGLGGPRLPGLPGLGKGPKRK
jgi:signal recognition particle subunit SRP54